MKDTSILIVEDDSNSAFVLKKILEKAGYDILPIALNGEKALQFVEEKHPALILMDISLSGKMDGIETIIEVHKRYDIPVIYLTGHTSEDTVKRAKATTPYGFILKPYSTQMVLITTEMAFHKALVEKDSKETKLRLSVTLGSLASPVFSVTPNKVVNYVNEAGIKLLNQPIGKILNKDIEDLLPLWDAKKQKIKTSSLFTVPTSDTAKTHVIYVDSMGNDRHLYISVSVLKNIYNEIQGYVISLNEFTDQFYAEQTNQMLAASLDNSQDGCMVVDIENDIKILYVNQCFRSIFQIPDHELINTSLSQFFCKGFNENIILALREKFAYSADTIINCSDNTQKITNWMLSPFADNKIAITVRDVTQLRKIEENLRQTQKIEAIGRLASGIAHDFNNLLSVINGCTDLALRKISTSEDTKEYLESIQNAGRQGAMLVQQLMLFGRKDNGKNKDKEKEVFASEATIQQTLNMLKNYLGKSIKISTHLDAALNDIKINPIHLDQILVNLCVNAKDAMPNGGTLEVNVSNYAGCPEGLLKGNFAKIQVKDSGMGMSKETQKKIFEPFFTTKPIGQRTGLGLASVYGLVKQYGGLIQVESTLGQGTTFTIFLPQNVVFCENISTTSLKPKKKCCFLDVDSKVAQFLIPCLKVENWKICAEKSEATIVISHEKDADIYIPREFCLESKIQHPLATAQILKELRNMA